MLFEEAMQAEQAAVWRDFLSLQCALFSPGEIEVLKELGLAHDRGPLLDLGCGNGAYALRLRQRFPRLEILGADSSTALLRDFSDDIKASGIGGIRVMRWAAGQEPPPAEVGGCRSALLSVFLQHVAVPLDILAALRQALPAQARVFIIEEDDGLCVADPPCPPLDRLLRVWNERHCGTRTFGRRVPGLARQAGLRVDDVRVCAHSTVRLGAEALFGYFKATLPLLLDERPGGLGRGQAIELARDLDRYVAEHGPRCCVIFPRMVVSATVS